MRVAGGDCCDVLEEAGACWAEDLSRCWAGGCGVVAESAFEVSAPAQDMPGGVQCACMVVARGDCCDVLEGAGACGIEDLSWCWAGGCGVVAELSGRVVTKLSGRVVTPAVDSARGTQRASMRRASSDCCDVVEIAPARRVKYLCRCWGCGCVCAVVADLAIAVHSPAVDMAGSVERTSVGAACCDCCDVVEVDPQFGIHRLVRLIKGRSSRLLRQEFPALKSRLPTLWTNSYFVSTVGGAPLAVIKKYVENQKNV